MATHYEILKVSKTATTETIKEAYRKLSLLYHPDKYLSSDISKQMSKEKAVEQFKLISAAYEILSDPQKRSAYDALKIVIFDFDTITKIPLYNNFQLQNLDKNTILNNIRSAEQLKASINLMTANHWRIGFIINSNERFLVNYYLQALLNENEYLLSTIIILTPANIQEKILHIQNTCENLKAKLEQCFFFSDSIARVNFALLNNIQAFWVAPYIDGILSMEEGINDCLEKISRFIQGNPIALKNYYTKNNPYPNEAIGVITYITKYLQSGSFHQNSYQKNYLQLKNNFLNLIPDKIKLAWLLDLINSVACPKEIIQIFINHEMILDNICYGSNKDFFNSLIQEGFINVEFINNLFGKIKEYIKLKEQSPENIPWKDLINESLKVGTQFKFLHLALSINPNDASDIINHIFNINSDILKENVALCWEELINHLFANYKKEVLDAFATEKLNIDLSNFFINKKKDFIAKYSQEILNLSRAVLPNTEAKLKNYLLTAAVLSNTNFNKINYATQVFPLYQKVCKTALEYIITNYNNLITVNSSLIDNIRLLLENDTDPKLISIAIFKKCNEIYELLIKHTNNKDFNSHINLAISCENFELAEKIAQQNSNIIDSSIINFAIKKAVPLDFLETLNSVLNNNKNPQPSIYEKWLLSAIENEKGTYIINAFQSAIIIPYITTPLNDKILFTVLSFSKSLADEETARIFSLIIHKGNIRQFNSTRDNKTLTQLCLEKNRPIAELLFYYGIDADTIERHLQANKREDKLLLIGFDSIRKERLNLSSQLSESVIIFSKRKIITSFIKNEYKSLEPLLKDPNYLQSEFVEDFSYVYPLLCKITLTNLNLILFDLLLQQIDKDNATGPSNIILDIFIKTLQPHLENNKNPALKLAITCSFNKLVNQGGFNKFLLSNNILFTQNILSFSAKCDCGEIWNFPHNRDILHHPYLTLGVDITTANFIKKLKKRFPLSESLRENIKVTHWQENKKRTISETLPTDTNRNKISKSTNSEEIFGEWKVIS